MKVIHMKSKAGNTARGKNILIAGATGYLGKHAVKAFHDKGFYVRVLARDEKKLDSVQAYIDETWIGRITDPKSLRGICVGMDYVFTSVGITRQKDRLSYMDVDYMGNVNLLEEAKKAGVRGFMYISVFNAELLGKLKIIYAKELFTTELKHSGLNYIIVRPNGFFSDMEAFLDMAKKGKVFLFGDGEYLSNPIHGKDLAEFCTREITKKNLEVDVGGPEYLSQNQVALQAFEAAGKEPNISHLPVNLARIIRGFLRFFTPTRVYGPIEFFLTVMTMEMKAPLYGKQTLKSYFSERLG